MEDARQLCDLLFNSNESKSIAPRVLLEHGVRRGGVVFKETVCQSYGTL